MRAALIGLGAMGRGHLDNYIRILKEGGPLQLVAVCDVDPAKFENSKGQLNLEGIGDSTYDFSQFHCYHNVDEMLAKEDLEFVTIALPTFLHCVTAVKCLQHGLHVLCEKPMAMDEAECRLMIETANQMQKQLMIGHCLRFWGEYEYLKQTILNETYGKPVAAYFYRGGSTPMWSFENWLLKAECGGGAVYDQHVHDVDTVQYMFGMPGEVSTLGKVVIPGSNFDTVSTNYYYPDLIVNSQNDWTLSGYAFSMGFRVNFEHGTMLMDRDGFHVAATGEAFYEPSYDKENAYYKEVLYFADCILNHKQNTINPPEDSMQTILLVHAEIKSAKSGGKPVAL